MPFTTQPYYINISLVTTDGYYRTLQNYIYTASAGAISGSISCVDSQIGTSTYCLFSLSTSSSISSSGTIQISLPNDFPISTGSSSCQINGLGLNSVSTCYYFAKNNSIQVGQLTSSSSNIAPINLSLNISITISPFINSYQVGVYTNSQSYTVDSGSLTLTTTSRQLLFS